ncbi:hypothetical protein [Pantanalinema sp. GBBB05]|uniref:hypothetical protein n=1 Tax=Pantanalinema sp. GBBB05 TaxID=2604139 RepID=UPI001D8B8A39|nr:helix-turn-helix transcriptional regulator [Pantanalinema sp. GBBB05]
MNYTLNRALKMIRIGAKLSHREFGDYLGVDWIWLSRFENQRIPIEEAAVTIDPALPIAARLAEVSVDWLRSLAIVCNPAAEQPAFACRRKS